MEQIYYHGFSLDAQYIGYREGMKVYVCQMKICYTNQDNQVILVEDLVTVILNHVDKRIAGNNL